MEQKELQPKWQWWDGLLRTGDFPSPLQDGVIHFGYFRRSSDKKGANARWIPIGIWGTSKGIVCEVDGKKVADISKAPWRPFDLLFHKSLQAVSHETYMAVTRQKAPWPDAPPVLEGPDPTPQPPTDDRWRARINDQGFITYDEPVPAADRDVNSHHNEPPAGLHILLVDKQAQLAQEESLVKQRLLLPITNQEEANSVSEHANRIATLAKWFEAEYERQNRPLLETQKVLRVDYLHPAQEANNLARTLTQHTATFLLVQQRALEAQQQAEAEAAAARAAEEAARGIPPEIVRPGAPTPPRRAGAGGLTGRRTTVREEPIGIVEDYMEFAGVLIRGQLANPPPGYCGSPELKNFLDARASAMAKKLPPDHTISGIRIEKQPKARR